MCAQARSRRLLPVVLFSLVFLAGCGDVQLEAAEETAKGTVRGAIEGAKEGIRNALKKDNDHKEPPNPSPQAPAPNP